MGGKGDGCAARATVTVAGPSPSPKRLGVISGHLLPSAESTGGVGSLTICAATASAGAPKMPFAVSGVSNSDSTSRRNASSLEQAPARNGARCSGGRDNAAKYNCSTRCQRSASMCQPPDSRRYPCRRACDSASERILDACERHRTPSRSGTPNEGGIIVSSLLLSPESRPVADDRAARPRGSPRKLLRRKPSLSHDVPLLSRGSRVRVAAG